MTTPLYEALPSPLCQQEVYPFRITSVLVELLRFHFADPRQIRIPALQQVLYRPAHRPVEEQAWNILTAQNEPSPTLFIDSLLRWEPARVDHRPAVLVGEGSYVSQQLGLGDGRAPKANVPWGEEPRQILWVGQHQIICLAQARQVSLLAQEVLSLLTQFAQEIRHALTAHKFRVSQCSAPFVPRESPDIRGITLTCDIAMIHSWNVRAEEPLFATVEILSQPPSASP